ncbi:hypothetical protein BAOM_1093 [Peribacillus asahii]|uniref:Uncharacterized protein n=1 Tax=Peribacillus asahii TaxID=228899 RepID=A0A3T0KN48_9BACI|nr:hypothetical protein BAOM_1093 [Peribacillus asahii]
MDSLIPLLKDIFLAGFLDFVLHDFAEGHFPEWISKLCPS